MQVAKSEHSVEFSLDDNIRSPQSFTYLRGSLTFTILTTRKNVFNCLQVNIYFSMSNSA